MQIVHYNSYNYELTIHNTIVFIYVCVLFMQTIKLFMQRSIRDFYILTNFIIVESRNKNS